MKHIAVVAVALLAALVASCGGSGDEAPRHRARPVLDHSSPAGLLASLGTIIREGREDALFLAYTARSIDAVKHNNKTGIGTAGTTDGLLREEIAIRLAQVPPRPPQGSKGGNRTPGKQPPFTPPALVNNKNGLLTVRWPSGNQSPILLVKENGRWLVDVLNGPGGEILLLKE